LIADWRAAFAPDAAGRPRTADVAVETRLQHLEQTGRAVDEAALEAHIQKQRAELPGVYIIGSKGKAPYMILRIEPNARVTGIDPPDGSIYDYAGVVDRMGYRTPSGRTSAGVDLALPVLPPTGGS